MSRLRGAHGGGAPRRGQLGTPREILNKRGALTDEEFAVIKRHPVEGADLIAAIDDPEVVAMVRQHHERLDGSGYPDGLRDSQITIGARIIAVADTFDALTSARPYRTPRKQRLALEVLRQEAGVRLDAHAVAAFRSYESGRRTATWSTLLVTVPDRIFAPLLWGAAPVAKTAAAAGAAVALGGSLMDMGPVGNAGAPATGARLAGGANSSVVDVRTSHRAAAGRDDDRKARDRREARSEVEGGRRPRGGRLPGARRPLAPGASAGQSQAPGSAANLGGGGGRGHGPPARLHPRPRRGRAR